MGSNLRHWLLAAILPLAICLGGSGRAASLAPVGPDDLVLGNPKAPVTVIEYASLGCPHCGRWENEVFPRVKAALIDSGKIRFVFRDYPLDGVSLTAAVLARCGGPARRLSFLQVLFASQASWAPSDDPQAELSKIGRLGGLTQTEIDRCLADKGLKTAVMLSRQTGDDADIDGTPTFFINGAKMTRAIEFDEFMASVKAAGG